MRIIALCFLLLLLSKLLTAQPINNKDKSQFGIIIGTLVASSTGKAVPFANITLQLIGNDSFIFRAVSDKNGSFEFNNLKFGYYRFRASSIGLTNTIIDSIYLRADRYDFNLGDIKMTTSNNQLNEVIVYAEKPLIENKDDKLTYNIGESALSSGTNTAELLKNIPLINNDPNGKILLKGKEPKILIDDKPTELNAQQLQDLLESLPGNSIEKIEVMTNPPPQYATETGGVINIVTKKGKIGWVGKLNLALGSRGEGNFSGNVSYRNKKISFNQTFSEGISQIKSNSASNRQNIYTDSINHLITAGNSINKNNRPNWRSQVDYEFNKNNMVGFVYQSNLNYFDNNSYTTYTSFNRYNSPYKIIDRTNSSMGNGWSNNLTLSFTHKGKNLAEVLRLIFIGNLNTNLNDRNFLQHFYTGNFLPNGIDSNLNQSFNNANKNASVRLEYTKPFHKITNNFSGGISYSPSTMRNSLQSYHVNQLNGIKDPIDLMSNEFIFRQNIFTVRVGLSLLFKNDVRFIIGAQAEQTLMQFDFIKNNLNNVQHIYWNMLPNVTFRKEFSKSLNTSIIYRATIKRPGITELNPTIDYSDPYTLRFGNPLLMPSLAHNFDWNIGYTKGKYYINTSFGFNKIKNVMNNIRSLIEGGKTQVAWLNIADRNEYEGTAFGGYTFNKKFRMNVSVGYTYNQYSSREKQLYAYRDGGTLYTTCNFNFTPTNLMTIEGAARYNNFSDPQGRSRSSINLNMGLQRKFLDRRLIVAFNVIDPFTAQQYLTITQGPKFYIESLVATTTRNFRVSISYQLNNASKKQRLIATNTAIPSNK